MVSRNEGVEGEEEVMGFLEIWPIGGNKNVPRRVQLFEVSFEALGSLLSLDGTFALKLEGLPENARISFVETDNERFMLRLYVEHESFPETAEGCTVPHAPAIMSTRYDLLLQGESDDA